MGSVDGESLIIRGYPEITLVHLSQPKPQPQIKSTPVGSDKVQGLHLRGGHSI